VRGVACADRDAAGRGDAREGRPELAVVVANAVPGPLVEGRGLAPPLGDPGVGRVARRAHVDDLPRRQLDDDEGEQRSKEDVRHRQEVARPSFCGVVAQEGGPGLPARPWGLLMAEVRLDRPLAHGHAQLQQLAADPLSTPEGVLGGHALKQGDGLGGERRSARSRARLPPPACSEARAMPAQQRLGLDEQQGPPPGADAARQQYQHRPIGARHDRARHAEAQHQRLLAQQGVLGEQLRPAPYHVSPGPDRMRQRQRPRPETGAERAIQLGTHLQKPLAATANVSHR